METGPNIAEWISAVASGLTAAIAFPTALWLWNDRQQRAGARLLALPEPHAGFTTIRLSYLADTPNLAVNFRVTVLSPRDALLTRNAIAFVMEGALMRPMLPDVAHATADAPGRARIKDGVHLHVGELNMFSRGTPRPHEAARVRVTVRTQPDGRKLLSKIVALSEA